MKVRNAQRHSVFLIMEDSTPIPAYENRTVAADVRHYFRDLAEGETRDNQEPIFFERGATQGYKVRSVANFGPTWLRNKDWQARIISAGAGYVNNVFRVRWPEVTLAMVLGRFHTTTGIPVGMAWDEDLQQYTGTPNVEWPVWSFRVFPRVDDGLGGTRSWNGMTLTDGVPDQVGRDETPPFWGTEAPMRWDLCKA